MLGSAARLFAAVVIAMGLVCLAPHMPNAEAKSKKQAEAKKNDAKKKDAKKKKDEAKKKSSSKRDDRASKRGKSRDDAKTARRGSKQETSSRAARSSSKRGKNEDRTASRDERPRRATPAPAPKREIVAASFDQEDEEEDEPAGPRPANRFVADIPTARVLEIQNALIKEGLMTGPGSGVYDQVTFEAMSAFQVRKGWNPVGVPTASALKELGVRKSSGVGVTTPARALETTAP